MAMVRSSSSSWKATWKFVGLSTCCVQVLYLLLTGEGGYLGRSVANLVRSEVEERQLNNDGANQQQQLLLPVQRAASTALAKLLHEEDAAFDTAFTTRESVLQNGFPLKWDQCTLRPLLPIQLTNSEEDSQKGAGVGWPAVEEQPPLRVVVLGGSSSAHSGKNCSYESHILEAGDPFAGRYSNILMHELYEDFFQLEADQMLEFDVINRAQGATDSVWNALMLDELVDVAREADVLIVEYGINDALGGTTKQPQRSEQHLIQMMNLWLWRVYSLFTSIGKPPPPILFVYLWDANFYKPAGNGTFLVNTDHLLHKGIGQSAWQAQHKVLEHYRQLGWTSIGAINVGAVIDNVAVAQNPYVLLDDKHHPNCGSMHLISAMIRHAIYTDLIQCNGNSNNHHHATSNDASSIRPMKPSSKRDDDPDGTPSELFQVLLSDNVKVGSLMQWEPNIGSSLLRQLEEPDNDNKDNRTQPDHGTKSYPWRADRKQSYTLSRCNNDDNDAATDSQEEPPIQFTLLEPELQWLGLGYKIPPPPNTAGTAAANDAHRTVIEMTINSVPIILTEHLQQDEADTNNNSNNNNNREEGDNVIQNHTFLEFDEALIIKEWIKLANYLPQPPSPQYHLSFCYKTIYPTTTTTITNNHIPRYEDCPYHQTATSIEEVCNIWDQDNFDPTQSCPYKHFITIEQVCFQWHDEQLAKVEEEQEGQQQAPSKKDTTSHSPAREEPMTFLAPQLNWIVGVATIWDEEETEDDEEDYRNNNS